MNVEAKLVAHHFIDDQMQKAELDYQQATQLYNQAAQVCL